MVDGQEEPRNKHVAAAVSIVKLVLNQWLVIGFGLACLFAYLWPNVAAHGGIIKSQYSVLYGGVGFIFLVSGLQLSPQKIRENLTNWRLHIITQGISFILIPLIWLAILWIIIAAGDLRTRAVDTSILVGMVVLSCLPTTIASNVVMTRLAGGDDAAAIVEVVIGNVLGSFLCPALIYAFIPSKPEFDPWRPASPSTLGSMYADVAMQLGLSVLVPLVAGQIIRYVLEKQVKWVLEKFYLAKVSTFFLCTLVWSTFSNAFQTGALYKLPKASVLFNVFMNIALYAMFTAICLYAARPPAALVRAVGSRASGSRIVARVPGCVRRVLAPRQMSKEQTVAVCFCGAAKTTSVGIPLVTAMWAKQDDLTRAYIQIPVLLYTMEQVFMAQMLVYVFRWYLRKDRKGAGTDETDEESGEAQGQDVTPELRPAETSKEGRDEAAARETKDV